MHWDFVPPSQEINADFIVTFKVNYMRMCLIKDYNCGETEIGCSPWQCFCTHTTFTEGIFLAADCITFIHILLLSRFGLTWIFFRFSKIKLKWDDISLGMVGEKYFQGTFEAQWEVVKLLSQCRKRILQGDDSSQLPMN